MFRLPKVWKTISGFKIKLANHGRNMLIIEDPDTTNDET